MLTVNVPKVLSAKELKAVSKIQELVQEALSSDQLEIAPWPGWKEKSNPQTGKVLGKEEARNCNLIFYTSNANGKVSSKENAELFAQTSSCIDFLANSGLYFRTNFYGKELIAIKPKSQERTIIVDGETEKVTSHYIVYTEEKLKASGPMSNPTVKAKFFSIFNNNPKMIVNGADTKADVVKTKSFADMIED